MFSTLHGFFSYFVRQNVDHFFKNERLDKALTNILKSATEPLIIRTILEYTTNLSTQAHFFNMHLGYTGESSAIYPKSLDSLTYNEARLKQFFESIMSQKSVLIQYENLKPYAKMINTHTKTAQIYICMFMAELFQAHYNAIHSKETDHMTFQKQLIENMKKVRSTDDLNLNHCIEIINSCSDDKTMSDALKASMSYWKNQVEQLMELTPAQSSHPNHP